MDRSTSIDPMTAIAPLLSIEPGELLSATRLAELLKIDRHALMRAHRAWRDGVPGAPQIRRHPGGFDPVEFIDDWTTLPECLDPDCHAKTFSPSGGCPEHRHVRARGVHRAPEVGRKISASKQGHATTVEARAKMSAAKRRYQPQKRFCEWCGDRIVPKRAGLDGVSAEDIAEAGLDLVAGHIVSSGGGRFCSTSHHLLWAWANDRARFPQDGPGASEFSCSICRRSVARYPSQVSNANSAGGRFICASCDPIYRRHRAAAARAVDAVGPRAPLSGDTLTAALERLWAIADLFEAEIIDRWPQRRGRRPPLAVDIVIATLHRRGFTDPRVCEILNDALSKGRTIPGVKSRSFLFDAEYVRQRRNRTMIRRV